MTTLLSLVEALARDPEAKADYAAEPDAYLARHGYGDLSPADVNEAVLHSSNTLPPVVAAQVAPGEGLSSVAAVDPTSFEPGIAIAYEDDLFGLDDSGDDWAVSPDVADDGVVSESTEAAHPFDRHDPHDLDQPSLDEPTADDAEEPATQEALITDPNDAAAQPVGQGPSDNPLGFGEGAPNADPAGSTDGLGPFEDAAASADADLDPMAPLEDPFAASDPLGDGSGDSWYQQDSAGSYAIEVPEEESDILDDVDTIHLGDD